MAVEGDATFRVRDEERLLGGDLVWWLVLLVASVPVLLLGLAWTPQVLGFLVLAIGTVMAGLAVAQVGLRLPYLTNRFIGSLILLAMVAAVIGAALLLFNMTLPVPTAHQDVMFKPPVSQG
jgi:Na+/citrate or Na+/malate symporter